MLRLTTFDGIAIARDGVPLPAVENRRFSIALLLVLAVRGARGISREALIELLWPDNGVKDPKHSLDQLLTVTRTVSGAPDLFAGAATLKLNADVIATDVEEFDAACRDNRLEQAASLYRAPFAEGFSAGASMALEQFLSNAAQKFASAHATAVRTLAERAEERKTFSEAARWWRVLLESDQLNGAVVVRLIASLVACNRADEALRTARGYARLLTAEYEREDPEITRWIVRLENLIASPDVRVVAKAAPSDASEHSVFTRGGQTAERESRAGAFVNRVIGGRYRLERLLRTGSIANVYLALDAVESKRQVEVHLLEPMVASCTQPEHFADVFRRVALLSHPNILPTFDGGADGAVRFIVTACSSDKSLDRRLKEDGPFAVPLALSVARDIAGALAFAHARNTHHGDLRPRHILIGVPNTVRAFGFAESIVPNVHDLGSAVLTLGSTAYHSPEQLLGDVRLDARSDVYALGCIVFEMLVGEPPFGGPSRPNRMLKVSQSAPLVRDYRDTVSVGFADVLSRCLARAPVDRYESGAAVLEALGAVG